MSPRLTPDRRRPHIPLHQILPAMLAAAMLWLGAAPASAAKPELSRTAQLLIERALGLEPVLVQPAATPIGPTAAAEPTQALSSMRQANDLDTIQTLDLLQATAQRSWQVAQLGEANPTSTTLGLTPAAYTNDSASALRLPVARLPLETHKWLADHILADTVRKQIVLMLALEMFRSQHARYPLVLEELSVPRRDVILQSGLQWPENSTYRQITDEAYRAGGVLAPPGYEWSYDVTIGGGDYLLGLTRHGQFEESVDRTLPVCSSLQQKASLPLLPGKRAQALVARFKARAEN